MKRSLCSITFSAFVVLVAVILLTFSVKAQTDIASDVDVTYAIQEDGQADVNYEITLRNIFTDRYAKSYTLQLEGTSPEQIFVTENGSPLEFTTEAFDQTKRITVTFPEAVVGKDKTRTFNVNYKDNSFASKNGDVWDVSIPKLGSPEAFRSYDIKLIVPEEFGDPAYISPAPTSQDEREFAFNKEIIASAGIKAAFGEFQTYELMLKYQLENPLHQDTFIEIAIPPDTSYQKIYIKSIEPRPDKLISDEDGNWIASYSLNARQQMEVDLVAHAQVFNSPIQKVQITEQFLQQNTQATDNWQINDPAIQALAKQYKTPKEIYEYVVRTLEYDKERVTPNADRLGAVKALQNPNLALCVEYTDLFIAIARAAGIPAREVNGYAFSDNTSSQPLSLVTDVLHAWPEYWDVERNAWIAVDPTWEDTTGGIDYFNHMDLKHIAFAVHGKSDTLPYPAGSYKLGAYPDKNVEVQVSSIPNTSDSKPEISVKPTGGFPIFKQMYEINIYNPGPSALYNVPVKIDLAGRIEEYMIEALLPFGSETRTIITSVGLFASDMPDNIDVNAGAAQFTQPSNKTDIALYHSAVALLFILAITVGILIYLSPWKR